MQQPGPCLGEPCGGSRAWLRGTFIREAASIGTSRRTRERKGARSILVQPASSDDSQPSPGLPECLMPPPHRPNDKCQLSQPGRWVSYTTLTLCGWAERRREGVPWSSVPGSRRSQGLSSPVIYPFPVHLWVALCVHRMSMVEGPSTPITSFPPSSVP